MKSIKLGNRYVGDKNPCYIIAEIGGLFKNFEEAKRLIDSAIEIGVDSVKFQTLEADTVTTKDNYFNMKNTGKISQYELLKEFEISKDVQIKIVNYANEKNITIFSAPSHMNDLEIMKKMELPIFKIGSDLACHTPLLKEIGNLNKPIILSTGMCSLDEVRSSVNTILSTGNNQLAILHCVSNYPALPEESNLNVINTLKKEFNLPVGLSDHCIGSTIAIGAAAIGANIIEKHFKNIHNSPSPDDIVALNKEEFSSLIKAIRLLDKAKGNGKKIPTDSEKINLKTNRVSIISSIEIHKGEIISKGMLDIKRPGIGIQPIDFEDIIGRKAKINISKDIPLTFDMLE
jgi:N,N'-diacetyllegionaminate synthase